MTRRHVPIPVVLVALSLGARPPGSLLIFHCAGDLVRSFRPRKSRGGERHGE